MQFRASDVAGHLKDGAISQQTEREVSQCIVRICVGTDLGVHRLRRFEYAQLHLPALFPLIAGICRGYPALQITNALILLLDPHPFLLCRTRACRRSEHGTHTRLILTRDALLLRRTVAPPSIFVQNDHYREQLHQVVDTLHLDPLPALFTRCVECNCMLQEVAKDEVRTRVPEYVWQTQ